MPNTPRPGSLSQREISEAVYDVIRERILSCQLAPEQGLAVDALARELAVSRISVREALGRLWADDLIEIVTRQRTVVAQIRPEHVRESFEVREALEGKACELLRSRIDARRLSSLREINEQLTAPDVSLARNSALEARFHQSIVEYAGNEALLDLYLQLSAHLQIGRIHYRSDNWRTRLLLTRREHNAVIDALAEDRIADAREHLTWHIRCSRERMIGDLTGSHTALLTQ
jgi:GntR family transcriptional regulator, rspAB operon transcriptional repressor